MIFAQPHKFIQKLSLKHFSSQRCKQFHIKKATIFNFFQIDNPLTYIKSTFTQPCCSKFLLFPFPTRHSKRHILKRKLRVINSLQKRAKPLPFHKDMVKQQQQRNSCVISNIILMYLKSAPVKGKKNSAINSAALQDHIMRQFNFGIDEKVNVGQPVRRKTHDKLPSINRGVQKQIQKLQKIQKNSILPYEDETLKKLKQKKQDEIKMAKYTKKLTLAQKLGLIQAPPLPLNAEDWLAIEQKSKARNDSQNCCSICLQDFKVQQQTLLSCSHVFHEKCLSSYEKHNKVRCCPICRRRDYQKKAIDQALKVYTMKCITLIQRIYRGSRDRIKLYSRLVETKYEAKSTRFRRRLIGFKMWRLSLRIQEKVKLQEEYFNKLLKDVENKFQKSKEAVLDEMVEIQRKKMVQTGQVQQYLQKLGLAKKMPGKGDDVDWQEAKAKGVARQEDQCAICLTSLWTRQVCLLSCSHMFHAACVQGFQRYALPGNQNKCPCCRSTYQKRLIQPLGGSSTSKKK